MKFWALFCVIALSKLTVYAADAPTSYPLDTVIYKSIVASYLENPLEIERYTQSLEQFDEGRKAQGAPRSDTADNLAWLWAESLAGSERRKAGYERVLSNPVDERVKANLEAALSADPANQIESTRRQDRADRWADLFNSIGRDLSRIGNGQLAMGFNIFNDIFFLHRQFTKVSERQRKEWHLIDTYLRQHPDGPPAGRYRARKQAIEANFKDDAIRRCMDVARGYADRGWWHAAYFYVRAAEEAGYSGQSRFRRRVREAVANEQRWKERSLAVADTEQYLQTREQVEAYGRLLKSLAYGDGPGLSRESVSTSKLLAGTPMADEMQDVVSILYEWAGDRRKALDIQRDLALRHPNTLIGQVAAARLEDPYYNPRARLDQEEEEYRRRQRHFILTGQRSKSENVMLASQMAITSAFQFGIGFIFIGTDMLVRSVIVSAGTPVSPGDVLAASEDLLANSRNLLTPAEQAEVRVRMGVLYSKLKRYDDAEASFQKARILSPYLKTQLDRKSSDEQLRRILEMPDPGRQVIMLERFVKTTSDKDAAARANETLNRLRTETKIDFEIPLEWILEDGAHWQQLGAGIPPELIDGSRGNGELNDRGLVFWRDTATATFVLTDGRKGHVNLTPQRRAALHAAAEMWADRKMQIEESETARALRKVPFEIEGSAGSAGLLVYPTIKRPPLSPEDKRKFW